ncbi:HEPN domain-containing protein [Burkholderia seminalis]|uniref:HEPN domain-containing protein n=1 Tax=Burkholderia seminalis TaxID=488731 RepID=UPI00158BFBC6|nr:HEPN domain-containing protein [Burkholderia seminalis]
MTTSELEKFWLHVPFAMNGGTLANAHGAALTLLGRRATLHVMPALGESRESARNWIHWLMFEPLTEPEARTLMASLRARVPALSVFAGAAGNVVLTLPISDIQKAVTSGTGRAVYSGSEITLVPVEQVPSPSWIGGYGFSSYNEHLLVELNNCADVTDDRLLAALELWATASYENLPRTKFLTYLTILDSLSVQAARGEAIVKWIDAKIVEAEPLQDPGIAGALENLKRVSHTAALKALVARAADFQGLTSKERKEKIQLAGTLYRLRSKLSHQGSAAQFDPAKARELVAFVLRAAIEKPAILDVEPPTIVQAWRRCRRRRVERPHGSGTRSSSLRRGTR